MFIPSFDRTLNPSLFLILTVIRAGICGDQFIWETESLKPDPSCPEAVFLFFSSSSLSFVQIFSMCVCVCVGGMGRGCRARELMLFCNSSSLK